MYAIRQKSTQFFMPKLPKGSTKGGTWLEPAADVVPRLFSTERAAVNALRWWLAGKVRVVHGFYDEAGDGDWQTVPAPHRKADDMEIVEVQLVEVIR